MLVNKYALRPTKEKEGWKRLVAAAYAPASLLQVIAAIAPIIAVVGLLQPLNGYVFVGDGILQGTQDFVYEVIFYCYTCVRCLTMVRKTNMRKKQHAVVDRHGPADRRACIEI